MGRLFQIWQFKHTDGATSLVWLWKLISSVGKDFDERIGKDRTEKKRKGDEKM